MQYMLLVRVSTEADPTPEEADPTAWDDELERRRIMLMSQRLEEPTDATTVRVREGKKLVTDGPFAEYKEHIGGFCVIEVADVEEATALAQRHPVTTFGAMEVREVWPFGNAESPAPAATAAGERVRYVLLMAAVPDGVAPTADDANSLDEWLVEMERRGVTHRGDRLRPADEAVTVRTTGGEQLATHGPFAEVQEQVAGFEVIDVADLDEAIEIAALHPSARLGAVEIRPAWRP